MKEQLIELLNNSKTLDKFFFILSKEKNPKIFLDMIDKDFSKAYERAVERDRSPGQKIYPKKLQEAISNCRYITSTLMETKKFGGRFFLEEKNVNVAVDFLEKFYYTTQIKRMDSINERSFGDLVSKYSNKGIITLRVYILENNPEFIGTHTTSCGMKIVVATEDSLHTDFNEKEFENVFEEIRKLCDIKKKEIFSNERIARKILNEHDKIVIKASTEWKHADSFLDNEDTLIDFREEQNRKIYKEVLKACEDNSVNIEEFDFGKTIEEKKDKKNKEDLW